MSEPRATAFEPITFTTELEPDDSQQLAIGNDASIGPTELLGGAVTTTICDVRRSFFANGQDSTRRHEAVVVVFQFKFGSQQRRSRNPVKSIGNVQIKVDVYEAVEPSPSGGTSSQMDDGEDDTGGLQVRRWYPTAAKGAASATRVQKTSGGSLDPTSPLGFSVVNLSYSRESETVKFKQKSLASWPTGDMGMAWQLEEGGNERGVPDILCGAVLLQTDGLAFSLAVEFSVRILGGLYRGTAEIPIDSKLLWERQGRDAWESEWEDFDSKGFQEWVRRKTENNWAETAVYDFDKKADAV